MREGVTGASDCVPDSCLPGAHHQQPSVVVVVVLAGLFVVVVVVSVVVVTLACPAPWVWSASVWW